MHWSEFDRGGHFAAMEVPDLLVGGNFGKRVAGLDREALTAAERAPVEEEPLTPSELGRRLAERWPDRDPAALAQAIRAWVRLVQVPPRGVWGRVQSVPEG